MTLPSTAVETAIAQCPSRWAMARGNRLNTSIALAAVHGLSGLFRAVSAVEPSVFRPLPPFFQLQCCFTSTEARWLIRDGDRVGRGRKTEGSTAETARKRPERPRTAARTMKVLRRCPLAIAQRLVHCAIAVSTAVLGQSQRQCPLHCY